MRELEGMLTETTVATMHEVSYNLGSVEQIPLGEGLVFYIEGMSIAVFRTRQGNLFATQAACPHRSGPLADGIIGSGQIVCPLHAYKFDLATGKPLGNDCGALQTYAVSLDEDGDILLSCVF